MEISDSCEHFKGKTIIVKGRVVKFKGKPQIEIKNADQIEIVDEDSNDEPASSEPEELDSDASDKDSTTSPESNSS